MWPGQSNSYPIQSRQCPPPLHRCPPPLGQSARPENIVPIGNSLYLVDSNFGLSALCLAMVPEMPRVGRENNGNGFTCEGIPYPVAEQGLLAESPKYVGLSFKIKDLSGRVPRRTHCMHWVTFSTRLRY